MIMRNGTLQKGDSMKFDFAIKHVFNTDPRAVASYLRYVVSPELLAALELPTLRRVPSDWVSTNLVQRFGLGGRLPGRQSHAGGVLSFRVPVPDRSGHAVSDAHLRGTAV